MWLADIKHSRDLKAFVKYSSDANNLYPEPIQKIQIQKRKDAIIVDFVNMNCLLGLLDILEADILRKTDGKFVRLMKKFKFKNWSLGSTLEKQVKTIQD